MRDEDDVANWRRQRKLTKEKAGGDTPGGIKSSLLLRVVAVSSWSVSSTIKIVDEDDDNNNPSNPRVDSPALYFGEGSERERETPSGR